MRVIAGEYRRRRIKSLRGLDVRPTPDRLREALFNVLAPRLRGRRFVDAYAGCGSVGIEALSRGAEHVVFIERKRAAAEIIRENLLFLGVTRGFEIRCAKVKTVLPTATADIVFLDPPYKLVDEYEASLTILGDNPPPLAIAQHASRHSLEERYGALTRRRTLRQGDNSLSFYEPAGPPVSARMDGQCDSACASRGCSSMTRTPKPDGPPVSSRMAQERDSGWTTRGFSDLARSPKQE